MRLRHTLTAATGALLLATLTPTADATTPTKILNSDLQALRLDPATSVPGGLTQLQPTVVNNGPATTTAPFTITVHLPQGTHAEADNEHPFFPDTCRSGLTTRTVNCTFPAGLRSSRTAAAIIPIRINPDLPIGTLTGGWWRVTDLADDPHPANNRADFTITLAETAPAL
ncbi:hypothetical protein [Streptomyces lavendulae]